MCLCVCVCVCVCVFLCVCVSACVCVCGGMAMRIVAFGEQKMCEKESDLFDEK